MPCLNKTLILLTITISLISHAHAKSDDIDRNKNDNPLKYQRVIETIERNDTLQRFITRTLNNLSRYFINNNSISIENIKEDEQKSILHASQKQLAYLSGFDKDMDASISMNELRNGLKEKQGMTLNKKQFNDVFNEYIKLDLNGDENISYKEMRTLHPSRKRKVLQKNSASLLKELLNLDPNKDGLLDKDEIKEILKAAFLIHDADGNDTFDSKDLMILSKENRSISGFTSQCSFESLPNDVVVYASGAYSGSELDFQIDRESNNAGTLFDVTVNKPNQNIALILGSYDPAIWNISYTPKTNIVAVVASGYEKQIVTGLSETTNTIISTRENGGVCGSFYFGRNKLEVLPILSDAIFSKEVSAFYHPEEKGIIIIGDKDFNPKNTINNAPPIKSFRVSGTPRVGKSGIKDAVENGYLRKATKEDKLRWINSYIEKASKEKKIPLVKGGKDITETYNPFTIARDVYMVIKSGFTIPSDLYGGNSVTFIVEQGVDFPDGYLGHSDFFDFNNMTCGGSSPYVRC